MVDFQYKAAYGYEDLLHIMELLRAPGGCPWDREQDHVSLRRNFLEETCEAVEAIDRNDREALCEELGDVLLQVVFHAELEREVGGFTMNDVVDGICKKLIDRHPHVFGNVTVQSTKEELSRWEMLKRREKGQKSTADAVDAVAKTLPALWRAEKMQSKAAKAGFDWRYGTEGPLAALEEDTAQLRRTVETGEASSSVFEAIGDVLFAVVKIAQSSGVDPEDALHRSCDRFANRFRRLEENAHVSPDRLSEEELKALWSGIGENETVL
jgi:MazG family protein